jgi:hypothetical protein
VIDPRVAIEDVDPKAFAHINAVLSRRDRSTQTSTTVVHGGVGSLGDVEALRRAHGVDELVLLDQAGLDDLSAQLVEIAKQADNQGDLLVRCRQAYVDHWAVTIVPPPAPPTGWAPVQHLLASVPDHHWIEVQAGDWVLAAEVEGGRVVRITSVPPPDANRAVRLEGTVEDFDAVLLAPDPWAELEVRFGWPA